MTDKKKAFSFIDYLESTEGFKIDEDVEYVYHYTTVEALVGGIIPHIPSHSLCFWATHSQYMNDPTELSELEVVSKSLTDLSIRGNSSNYYDKESLAIKKIENTHILSFSENEDSLPMWSMYAKNGAGIALGFKVAEINKREGDNLRKCNYQNSTVITNGLKRLFNLAQENGNFFDAKMNENDKVVFRKLVQGGKSISGILKSFKDSIFGDVTQEQWDRSSEDKQIQINLFFMYIFGFFMSSFACKHPAYEYEKEWRLLLLGNSEDKVKYRVRNGMLIPYIEVEIPRIALQSITIGPTQNMELAKQSLEGFLKSKGFNDVEIRESQVPYRG